MKITEIAKEKLIDVMIVEKTPFLRFGLQGGGCSGFTYFFAAEDSAEEGDLIVKLDESRSLLIDPMSNMYLEEAEIDVKRDLMGESFVFNNPKAVSSCGCGSSVTF